MLLSCVQSLLKDFHSNWDDGSGIMTYEKGPRRQPQGFHLKQVMTTALSLHCKRYTASQITSPTAFRLRRQRPQQTTPWHGTASGSTRHGRGRLSSQARYPYHRSVKNKKEGQKRSTLNISLPIESARRSWQLLEHRQDRMLC